MVVVLVYAVRTGLLDESLEPLDGLGQTAVVATQDARNGNVAEEAGVKEARRLACSKYSRELLLKLCNALLLLVCRQPVQLVGCCGAAMVAAGDESHPCAVEAFHLLRAASLLNEGGVVKAITCWKVELGRELWRNEHPERVEEGGNSPWCVDYVDLAHDLGCDELQELGHIAVVGLIKGSAKHTVHAAVLQIKHEYALH
mmetsp:Transcript_35745/g.80787  ORF Transcript_35745/g.80787 Transcript_35745/m.80787 type:complete len:200 (+) Transcript_35745:2287-2886(+)